MTNAKARNAAEAVEVQLDEPVSLRSDSMSGGGNDREAAPVEQISDLQALSDQSAAGCLFFREFRFSIRRRGYLYPLLYLKLRSL